MNLKAHHVGCAVASILDGLERYVGRLGFSRHSKVFDISSQKVKVCFIELEPGIYRELINPTESSSSIDQFLKIGFYHMCFLVPDLGATAKVLNRRGFAVLPPFRSEIFDGNACQFLMSRERHLIELAEMSLDSFEAFFESAIG